MAREAVLKRNKIAGYVVLALVLIVLIYIVVSLLGDRLPSSKYKGLEKLRGDHLRSTPSELLAISDHVTPSLAS